MEPGTTANDASPSEELAGRVVAALREKGLIDAAREATIKAKIAGGKANEDDWRSWVDFSRGRRPGDE